jgi:pyruvate kinase
MAFVPLADDESVRADRNEALELLRALTAIRSDMVELADRTLDGAKAIDPAFTASARNFLHYLALRRRDLRSLQLRLEALGVSSLGRAESHVLATVDAVIRVLSEVAGSPVPGGNGDGPLDFDEGYRLLEAHAAALLGSHPTNRTVRIMVTVPSEAVTDATLIHRLLDAGMDCMRINCAHDDQAAWARMIQHLRRAEQALGRSCRILMDLAGPKLRTGPMEPGPAVVKFRPRRDQLGRVVAPARVWLTDDPDRHKPPAEADAVLPVPEEWLADLVAGERIRFKDSRDARRRLTVVDIAREGVWTEGKKTAYVVPGTLLLRKGRSPAPVGELPPPETVIPLQRGDELILTRDLIPGRATTRDSQGRVLTPATIGCSLPEIFDDVEIGERILFDDGRICGSIGEILADRLRIRITETRIGGDRLRADKGINLPDSELKLSAITAKDLEDLPFVAEHADIVGLSFVNQAADVRTLRKQLDTLGDHQHAILLKIETRRAFENLPAMLLAAMEGPTAGVMIARGDLAVECGFERLAEVQEEILWICEAAHLPVIWATQVLETLAKTGMPSRAEITDAAMGNRAECVMLNKGPEIIAAVEALDNILRRMETHQAKKRPLMRELRLASAPLR